MQSFLDTEQLSVSGTLKKTPASLRDAGLLLQLQKMQRVVLGTSYSLSVLFTADALSRRLNTQYRKKAHPTNVLSFPLSKKSGELFINVRKSEREAIRYGRTLREHVLLLALHGMLHLKGYDHGPKMDKEEQRLAKHFGLPYSS